MSLAVPAVTAGGAFLVLLIDLAGRKPRPWLLQATAFLCALAAMGLTIPEMVGRSGAGGVLAGNLSVDGLAGVLSMTCLLATAVTIMLSAAPTERRGIPPAEYYALVLLAAAGMVMLVRSEDLITLFLSVELLSISVYSLCGMARSDARAAEGAMKYFVCGAFASAFLLYGSALLYGAAGGELRLARIPAAVVEPELAGVGLLLFLVGFFFKVGAVPFHQWVPDAYESAPTPVTALMSVGVKTAAFGALMRVLFEAGSVGRAPWTEVFWGVCLLTMVAGNLLAAVQKSVKRMLAYSGIAHTGYAMIGVLLAGRAVDTVEAQAATVMYLITYAFMTLGAFAFVIYAGRGGADAETYEDYAGLAARRPWAALAMTVFMLSLAGIPPTAGFFGKFVLFKAGVEGGQVALVVVGVLTSLVSLTYYLRVVVYLYMKPAPEGAGEEKPDIDAEAAVALAAALTVVIGVLPHLAYTQVVTNALERPAVQPGAMQNAK